MKGINGNAILNARKIISDVTDTGNIKKYKLTPYEFYSFYDSVIELYNTGHTKTISEKVKDLLVKCGFESSVYGIGWKVSAII